MAKIQQSLPEYKRDGSTVLNSLSTNLIYSEKSTGRASGVLSLVDSIPVLAKKLQDSPEEVIQEFEQIRGFSTCGYAIKCHCTIDRRCFGTVTKPNGFRFSVTGNVLAVNKPRSTWKKYFTLPVRPFSSGRVFTF